MNATSAITYFIGTYKIILYTLENVLSQTYIYLDDRLRHVSNLYTTSQEAFDDAYKFILNQHVTVTDTFDWGKKKDA